MTTGAALAGLASVATKLERPTIRIREKSSGRCTGWEVKCSDAEHGTMPVLAPSQRAAVLAGSTHLEHEHEGTGDVFVKGKLVATSRRGKPSTAGYEDADRATRRAVGLKGPKRSAR